MMLPPRRLVFVFLLSCATVLPSFLFNGVEGVDRLVSSRRVTAPRTIGRLPDGTATEQAAAATIANNFHTEVCR